MSVDTRFWGYRLAWERWLCDSGCPTLSCSCSWITRLHAEQLANQWTLRHPRHGIPIQSASNPVVGHLVAHHYVSMSVSTFHRWNRLPQSCVTSFYRRSMLSRSVSVFSEFLHCSSLIVHDLSQFISLFCWVLLTSRLLIFQFFNFILLACDNLGLILDCLRKFLSIIALLEVLNTSNQSILSTSGLQSFRRSTPVFCSADMSFS